MEAFIIAVLNIKLIVFVDHMGIDSRVDLRSHGKIDQTLIAWLELEFEALLLLATGHGNGVLIRDKMGAAKDGFQAELGALHQGRQD
uniref:Uncharacterized protein n=1 Tax=viral metagenome TaxID=1070528 RepID=A0A6H1ZUT1_9ZZZZ